MNQKIIVITGASTGFGRRTAERLCKDGHIVFATMRNTTSTNANKKITLEQLASKNNWHLHVVDLDVTDENSVQQAIQQIIAKHQKIDVLINNAGIWGPGVLEAFSINQWKEVFDVNVFGSIRVLKAVLPFMRNEKSGLIVQISSLQGRFILPYSGPYVASKHAVEGALETFSYELNPFGIDTVIIEPYDFLTEMKDKAINYVAQETNIQIQYGNADAFIKNAYLVADPNRAGNPEEVVDAIQLVINQPSAERKLRVTVKNPLPQIEQINQLAREMHQGLFPYVGLQHLLKP